MSHRIINAEFVAWAKREAQRIEQGKSKPYHATLCDPPYGIAFMGKEFDTFKAFRRADNKADVGRKNVFGRISRTSPEYLSKLKYQEAVCEWGEVLLPLLYPGAVVFMFGGTRTWHRVAAGMEDAGFHLWDTLMWVYGQGFPKAGDISKLIDKKNRDKREEVEIPRIGHGPRPAISGNKYKSATKKIAFDLRSSPASETSRPWSGHKTCALKPAWEPILCFRAPSKGMNYAELAMKYGSGSLNIDGARITTSGRLLRIADYKKTANNVYEARVKGDPNYMGGSKAAGVTSLGRYPANFALECTCTETELVDAPVFGDVPKGRIAKSKGRYGDYGLSEPFKAYRGKMIRHTDPNCPAYQLDTHAATPSAARWSQGQIYADDVGPSRFFYTGKASKSERVEGLKYLEINNNHPTVKPIDLNKWLATLLLPPDSVKDRRILVPFGGSGSEAIGAAKAGWDDVIVVEQDKSYCELLAKRFEHWVDHRRSGGSWKSLSIWNEVMGTPDSRTIEES